MTTAVGRAPSQSALHPAAIRNTAPPSNGKETNQAISVSLSCRATMSGMLIAPMSNQTMKLTVRCSHAPASDGQ